MKPGEHHRSKQRCQDSGWKVYGRAQLFVLPSSVHTIQELLNQHVSIGEFLSTELTTIVVSAR